MKSLWIAATLVSLAGASTAGAPAAGALTAQEPAAQEQAAEGAPAATPAGIQLASCHIANYSQEVRCGTHTVFEDRAAGEGRQIEIQFAVIPAINETVEPDPVVIFAGGPGQAAMSLGPFVRSVFSGVHESRDVVLIDQRGMGASHGLDCEMDEEQLMDLDLQEQERVTRELLAGCLEQIDADVTLYTQDLANADIHEILLGLGYEQANLYGVSWGSRSALLYAHQFPEHVRTMVLDGILPLENAAPAYAAVDAERALRELFADCAADAGCSQAYPDLEADLRTAMQLLGPEGKRVTLTDPTTGEPQTFLLTGGTLGEGLRSALYAPTLSRLVPVIISQAARSDYRALQGVTSYLAATNEGGMTMGASLTIFCSEELPRIGSGSAAQQADPQADQRLLGRDLLRSLQNACSVWPTGPVPQIYSQDIRPEAPALLLSGDLDPITPPRWGEKMAEALPNSLHLVAAGTAHNVAPQGCAPDLIEQFINQGSLDEIDGSCLDEPTRPSFFTRSSGPAGAIQ